MSVIVKGMEMPEKGEHRMTLYVDSDGSAYIDVESFPEDKDKFDAIEVPPHGDLIDRVALNKEIDKAECYSYDPFVIHMSECINDAPVIIEAEEGE